MKIFRFFGIKKRELTIADGYVVKDDIEYGSGNIIPIWMFGLNY